MKRLDDAALVKHIQSGSEAAFSELVSRHEDRLYRLAQSMLFDNGLAGDAVQEVFLRAFTGFGNFRFGAAVFTWLYAILRNVCRELNRKNRDLSAVDPESISDTLFEPEKLASNQQQLEQVIKIIKRLPERQRDVFLLRVMEGLSVEETAKSLRCRPGTVKTHLHRASQTIKASKIYE